MDFSDNVISIKDLSFKYKDQEKYAVKDINFQVKPGELVVIMGPSGAGKSTLANCLNGLIPHFVRGQYEGQVIVSDSVIKDKPVSFNAQRIGLVFQDFEAQLFSTNVKLEIAFAPENFNVPKKEIEVIIKKVLDTVKLYGVEERHPATLSGGQKQRLAIGSVLASGPKIICMDEPTTDLDPIGKQDIFKIAKGLHENQNITLIIIEHETEEALNADRVILMNNGTMLMDGKAQEVLREIDLMSEMGIMPLQVPIYFNKVTSLEKQELPLTPQEGTRKFKELSMSLREDVYKNMVLEDKKREEGYGEVIVDIKSLKHTYSNGNEVLKGIDLQIKEREFIAVLGHNGSGKTTLVKHINGLLLPTAGQIIINGKDTKKSSIYDIGKDVGYVFQNPDHQIFADTVYEEVAFSPKMRGCSKDEVDRRVKEALKSVDLEGYEKEDPFSLTKGERQRIAVASVLSAKPKVIILDEPTTGLDYKEQRKMMELIKRLNENGHTIIMITHSMWVVSEYAHKVAVVKDGYVQIYGTTREVFGKEEELYGMNLRVPHIVALSNGLGKTLLSVDEMIKCTSEVK